ncbi:MAG: hypothetical protein L3J96_00380 [Thermoplasmata archaeon]|nr:hypothetical protein [Thermoplasmata archaeon]
MRIWNLVTIDWETIALSLGAAVLVAGITFVLNERSNQRGFRREKLYNLKLETYLDLFTAFDMLIDALDILSDRSIGSFIEPLAELLRSLGVSEANASAAASQIASAFGPPFRAMQWSALGYPAPPPSQPSGAAPGPTAAPSSTPGAGIDQAVAAAAPFLFVMAESTRRFNRAYSRLALLGVSDDVSDAAGKLFKKLARSGVEGGFRLATGPLADREKLIKGWRRELATLGEQLAADLLATMS